MGRWHADALSRAGVALAGVVDPDTGRAAALAGREGQAWSALSELPPDAGVDAVHVCSPSGTHEPVIREAVGRGLHVLVEKPFAPSAPVTSALLDAARSAEVLACPVHQFVFQPGVRRLLKELPEVAPVLHADAVVCSAGAEGRSPEERDATALDIVPHALSLFLRLLPGDLGDVDWQVQHPGPGELRISGQAGAATVAVLVSMAGRPTRNTLRVVGAHGTVHADLFHGFSVTEPGSVSRGRKITRPFTLSATTLAAAGANLAGRMVTRRPAYPGLQELVDAFYDAVRRGGPAPIGPDETLQAARAMDAIRTRAGTPETP